MPIRLGKRKYKKFAIAAAAIEKKKGFSKKRAAAYTAAVLRKTGQLHARKKHKRKK